MDPYKGRQVSEQDRHSTLRVSILHPPSQLPAIPAPAALRKLFPRIMSLRLAER